MTVRPISPDELAGAARIQALGFRRSVEDTITRYKDNPRYGVEAIRVLENDEDRLVAALSTFEREVRLHGRDLSAGLVASVSVPPEERRRGYANALMAGLLAEYYERELPVSLLFPFAVGFYRRLGYGLVNYNRYFQVPPSRIPAFRERFRVYRATPDDTDAMRACYQRARRQPGHNGWLTRTQWEWQNRIWQDEHEIIVSGASSETIEGYLVFQRVNTDIGMCADILEWVATTESAWQALAGFLHALGDQVTAIRYNAPQDDPLVYAMQEPYEVNSRTIEFCFRPVAQLASGFMLRLVHLPTALRARGYPASVETRFTLRIEDEQLPANTTPLHVYVAHGTATVTPAEDTEPATVESDIMTFSELYAGVLRADQARRVGRLHADDDTCEALTATFATGPMYMHRADWF